MRFIHSPIVLLALLATCTDAGTTRSFTYSAGTYPGSRDRQYKVYVPDNVPNPAPLVMALHGCEQVVSAATSCATKSSSPAAHVAAGRAVRGGLFNLRALANGDRVDIGFGWDAWSQVTLYEGAPGQWYSRKPAECP